MSLGSITAKNRALDANYGSGHAASWPATVYLHLYVGDPTQGGTELTSAGGYAPQPIANDDAHWPLANGGLKSNGAAINFPPSAGAWSGSATYAWLTDALGLTPPGSPNVSNVGTPGTTGYSYKITALNAAGETTASGTGSTSTGNAVLDLTNYNTVSWSAVAGATSYNVYKLVGGVFQLLGNTAGTSLNDQGAATTPTQPPSTNTTSNLLDGGPLANPIVVTTVGVNVGFPTGSITIAT